MGASGRANGSARAAYDAVYGSDGVSKGRVGCCGAAGAAAAGAVGAGSVGRTARFAYVGAARVGQDRPDWGSGSAKVRRGSLFFRRTFGEAGEGVVGLAVNGKRFRNLRQTHRFVLPLQKNVSKVRRKGFFRRTFG